MKKVGVKDMVKIELMGFILGFRERKLGKEKTCTEVLSLFYHQESDAFNKIRKHRRSGGSEREGPMGLLLMMNLRWLWDNEIVMASRWLKIETGESREREFHCIYIEK